VKREIESKLKKLEKNVNKLKEHSDIKQEKLENNELFMAGVERKFHIAIENVIDISSMIISYEEMDSPENYRETITRLTEKDILDEEFAERFQNAASFRNILVHQYEEIEIEKLHEYLTENLSDFDIFAKNIAKYVRETDE